jgi:hypothetical protein
MVYAIVCLRENKGDDTKSYPINFRIPEIREIILTMKQTMGEMFSPEICFLQGTFPPGELFPPLSSWIFYGRRRTGPGLDRKVGL